MNVQHRQRQRYKSEDYLDESFTAKGLGGWRQLYLPFLEELQPGSVLEVGAGAPEFLSMVPSHRRAAVDIGDRFADIFAHAGVEFFKRDLDRDDLTELGQFEAIVCSDVFEHLINPAFALDSIADALAPSGVLLTHVPNEYRLDTVRIMLGKTTSVRYHGNHEEWEDPHFRRFTDIGFQRLLDRRFRFKLKITDLRYGRAARTLQSLGVSVPYFMEGGPTYLCTNDEATFARLTEIKSRMQGKI